MVWAIKTFSQITVGICKLDVTKIWCPTSDFSTAQRLTSPFAQCRGQHRLPSLQPGSEMAQSGWSQWGIIAATISDSIHYLNFSWVPSLCLPAILGIICHDVVSSPSLWLFLERVRTISLKSALVTFVNFSRFTLTLPTAMVMSSVTCDCASLW